MMVLNAPARSRLYEISNLLDGNVQHLVALRSTNRSQIARCEMLMREAMQALADENAAIGAQIPVELIIAQQAVQVAAALGKAGDDVDVQTLERAVVNLNALLAAP